MRTARVLLLDEKTGEVIDPVDVLSIANLIICNDGETVQQKLDSGKLQGKDGRDGKDGKDGEDGKTPNITIGTVTTIEADKQAYITKTGTSDNIILNFFIPKGEKGESFVSSGEIGDKLNLDYVQKSIGLYKNIPALQTDFEVNYVFEKKSALTGVVYSQSAWKPEDSWSLYIDDELLFEQIPTKEVGQHKVFNYFCLVEAWQTVKVIHHNNSGNSKEIWVDIDYLEIAD